MASTRREKDLARMRAERQAARRAAAAAKRKRRITIIASTVAVLVVAGAVAVIALQGRDDSTKPTASASPTPPGPAGPCTYNTTGEPSRPVTPPPSTPTATGPVTATMTTDQGVVAWTLDTDKAPCASNSMISLAAQKFFDGTPCHRLTTEGIFVLQCGDPTGTGTGGPGYQYAEEALDGAKYPRGTIAMAKSSAAGSTGSQFFLVYKDTDLPAEYTPVGTITTGLDVLDKIAAGGAMAADPTSGNTAPKIKVNIQTLTTAPAAG